MISSLGNRIVLIGAAMLALLAASLTGYIGIPALVGNYRYYGHTSIFECAILIGIPLGFLAVTILSVIGAVKKYRWGPRMLFALPVLVILWLAFPFWFVT